MAESAPVNWKGSGRLSLSSRGGRVIYGVLAVGVAALVAYGMVSVYVKPNEFGIKQVTWGAGKGIKPEIYYPGLHWVTPGTERMHTFATDVQVLNFTDDPTERAQDDQMVLKALDIQTSEGSKVTIDVSLLYRIENPYQVFVNIGPGRLYEHTLVIPRAQQMLGKRLGELDAEEFYNATKRADRVRLALADLNAELVPKGVRALQFFVRRYVYAPTYQQAIEQRKIQDQTVFKNKAEADMAQATAERDRIVAVGEATVKVELSRGDANKRKIDAEAELYARKQSSAGELQIKLAEAEGTRLENESLRGAGSENMVGLKMAEVLRGTKVIIIPTDGENGFNPLDLKSALKRFDVKEGQ